MILNTIQRDFINPDGIDKHYDYLTYINRGVIEIRRLSLLVPRLAWITHISGEKTVYMVASSTTRLVCLWSTALVTSSHLLPKSFLLLRAVRIKELLSILRICRLMALLLMAQNLSMQITSII